MSLQTWDAEDRISSLHRDHLQALRRAFFANMTTEKAPIVIGHILQTVRTHTLKERMQNIIEWWKNKYIGKEDIARLMQKLVKQSRKIQKESMFIPETHTQPRDQKERASHTQTWTGEVIFIF